MIKKNGFYLSTEYYTISYNVNNSWLFVDWESVQSSFSVIDGCEQMLKALCELRLSKVLNSNYKVRGVWNAEWVALNWFPRMKNSGLEHFAWIVSPEPRCARVIYNAIKLTPVGNIIEPFSSVEVAEIWLEQVESKQMCAA